MSKVRVVVVGQVPPPPLGQYIATEELFRRLSSSDEVTADYLRPRFVRSADDLRTLRPGKFGEMLRVVLRAARLRLSGRIDCFVYPVGGPYAWVVLRDLLLIVWLRCLSPRLVLIFHGGGFPDRWERSPWLWIARVAYRAAKAGVVFSEFGRRDPDLLRVSPVYVVPHEIPDTYDPAFVDRGHQRVRILYLGTISRAKRVPDLVAAFISLVLDHDLDLELHLVGPEGDDGLCDMISSSIESAGLGDRVFLHGSLMGDEKAAAYGSADIFVFPSTALVESFGLVLIEAMMWGLPVVATDWRAAKGIVGPGNVIVQPTPDLTQSLSEGILRVLNKRDSWGVLGEANRQRFLSEFRAGGVGGVERAVLDLMRSKIG